MSTGMTDRTAQVIFYMAGDAFNDFTYKHVAKHLGRQNLILSDGMHTGKAVNAELNNLLSSGIIKSNANEEFAMVWDDCLGDIFDAFSNLFVPTLREEFKGRALCHRVV